MGLLDGDIKKIVASGFKGLLLKGTLRRVTVASLDAYGDPATKTITTYSFEGIRDSFSAQYAAAQGIPVTDARILILAGSLNPVVEPRQDDQINIGGQWFQCRRVLAVDPAGATYTLAAFVIKAPS